MYNVLEQQIEKLEAMLHDMESDFAECARGVSPCFFCTKDETCSCSDDKNCYFDWQPHN